MAAARLSPDGKRLLTASVSGVMSVWDLEEGGPGLPGAVKGDQAERSADGLVRSPGGHPARPSNQTGLSVAGCGGDARAAGSAAPLATWENPLSLRQIGFSAEGRSGVHRLLADQRAGVFVCAGLGRGVRRTAVAMADTYANVVDLRLSPDASYVSTITANHQAERWEVASGKAVTTIAPDPAWRASALSPDGRWLAAAATNQVVRVWDLGSGQASGSGWTSAIPVSALAFDREGTRLAGTAKSADSGMATASGRSIAQTNGVGRHFVAFNLLGDRLLVWNRDSAVLGTARLLGTSHAAVVRKHQQCRPRSPDPFAERHGSDRQLLGQLGRRAQRPRRLVDCRSVRLRTVGGRYRFQRRRPPGGGDDT